MANQEKMLDEIRKRVIRTETRIMSLGIKLGFDLKEDDEVIVVADSKSAYIAVLDVSISTVINRCRQANLHGQEVVVYYDGRPVAMVRA